MNHKFYVEECNGGYNIDVGAIWDDGTMHAISHHEPRLLSGPQKKRLIKFMKSELLKWYEGRNVHA